MAHEGEGGGRTRKGSATIAAAADAEGGGQCFPVERASYEIGGAETAGFVDSWGQVVEAVKCV